VCAKGTGGMAAPLQRHGTALVNRRSQEQRAFTPQHFGHFFGNRNTPKPESRIFFSILKELVGPLPFPPERGHHLLSARQEH